VLPEAGQETMALSRCGDSLAASAQVFDQSERLETTMSESSTTQNRRAKRHKSVCIQESWQFQPRFVYLNVTIDEAFAMHKEDIENDPYAPAARSAKP
jgi:hypothetical protein